MQQKVLEVFHTNCVFQIAKAAGHVFQGSPNAAAPKKSAPRSVTNAALVMTSANCEDQQMLHIVSQFARWKSKKLQAEILIYRVRTLAPATKNGTQVRATQDISTAVTSEGFKPFTSAVSKHKTCFKRCMSRVI